MKTSLTKNESGIALVTAILVMMLASGLMAGMFAALLANQRSHSTDRDQSVAYAAAHAGLEKLTAGLAQLFKTDFSPSAAQLSIVDNTPPDIDGFTYTAPGGVEGSGYEISFTADPGPGANTGNPLALPSTDITTGPFEGFKGLITPYTLTVTARSETGRSEVRLRRELQTVAVPVFQFGIFGEKSLGFHAGPNFDFGGRVHTNQSLHIASGNGNTLTFRDKITAFKQVVRNTLLNGQSIVATNHQGNVSIPRIIGGAPGDYRLLLNTETSGTSAAPCIGAATVDSNCWNGWKNLSEVTYRTNIRTEATGAKQLNLPLTSDGAEPIDLIRRPEINSDEDTTDPAVFGQRYYAQASLRILLSDRATDITDLPGIAAGAPLNLANLAAAGYVAQVGPPFRTPVAASPGAFEPYTAGTGVANFRMNGAAAGTTLTIEDNLDGTFGATTAATSAWLKWASLRVVATGTAFNCTTLVTTAPPTLSNCTAHGTINGARAVQFLDAGGAVMFTLNASADSTTTNPIVFNGSNFLGRVLATRGGFYVGEDPVICTGFTVTTLTGCTWPALSDGIADDDPIYSGATTVAGTPLLGGFIKIEKQNAAGVWSDVTLEILNLGFADRNFGSGSVCDDPTPNAVIRLQRFRDNGLPGPVNGGICSTASVDIRNYQTSMTATDYQPLTLYDAREGHSRLLPLTDGMNHGGLFGYVALDMENFRRWVAGTIPGGLTGNQTLNNNGYIIYFSDRRGDHNENLADAPETGEYGFEDSINPAAAAWAKTNLLETGEDFNENETLETYGETPHALAVPGGAIPVMGFDGAARPWTPVGPTAALAPRYTARGRLARPVLFRRALKIVRGGMGQLPASGISIVAENPVYVQGNFNATAASVVAEPNVAAAIMGDSITLLSTAFTDASTFVYPNDADNRNAADTGYRFAMVTGKTVPFPKPAGWGVAELGSDGGVHNFMKMLEDWGGTNLRYRGSMVSLYYSRQAIGIYRADGNVYSPPTRGYNFDTDFLSPPLLPPGTPMFRDINTLKFRQILRPNQ